MNRTMSLLCAGLSLLPLSCSSPKPDPLPPDAGVVAGCAKPTKGPTQHGATVKTETWTADGSPHVLPYDTSIYETLTLEPCAEVLLAPGSTVTVSAGAKIIAEGTASKPIHIGAKEAGKPFTKIRALGGGTMRFAYVDIDGGGLPQATNVEFAGTLELAGDSKIPTQETLFVDHVSVKGSSSNGIVARDGGGFAKGSTDLTVTGAANYPVNMWSRAVDSLPPGAYTGNAKDEILLAATGIGEAIMEDATMHDRGVPYHVGQFASAGTLYIGKQGGAPGVATLTIEPGVTLRMKKGGVIYVEQAGPGGTTTPAQGALIAVGTSDKRIVFTSAEATPTAGDWLGIWYGRIPSATDKLDFVNIDYAGGKSTSGSNSCNVPAPGTQNEAAVRIFGIPAGGQFITNTIISNSAVHGIDRGWRADEKPDFLPTNTFNAIKGCKETFPRDLSGACPTTVPCP